MIRSLAAVSVCVIALAPALSAGAEDAMKGDPAAGKAKSATCAACHGAGGNSTNPEWPKLAGQHAGYIEKQIHDLEAAETRSNELMAPMIANLSDQDIADLAAYYASQPATGGFASDERVELGERLYRGGNAESSVPACIACHGPQGAGNALARFPRLSGQHATYIVKQLEDFRAGRRANDPAGMMRDAAKYLTPDEMRAVAEYVAGLH